MPILKDVSLSVNANSVEALDAAFLKVFDALAKDALNSVAKSSDEILSLSKNFLNQDVSDVLEKFHDLYFGDSDKTEQTEINSQVDDIFDQVKSQVDSNQKIEITIDESEEQTKKRLYLSGVQKQLEGLITLDNGLKEKIMPTIQNMQFEDAVRQRITHLTDGWDIIKDTKTPEDLEAAKRTIADFCCSKHETESYYSKVLGEPAPETTEESVLFF